jgi:DNA gyrase subunit A
LPDDNNSPQSVPSPPDDPGVNGQSLGEHIQPLNIESELRDSYLTYAMSVIVSRALPDVRDGLKPSQRRILVAMHDLGLGPDKPTTKCAGIIGETMKRYHPHGDGSIYPTLVRMAQWWSMRYKLIQGQGNFGSIAGLPAAAHRYTEAKLSPVAAEMLADLESETVDFIDNYDGRYREPLVLPSKFPNLLVNGTDGIAVGMATEMPPHNLGEVCNALILLIDKPDASLLELLQVLPGPDFPTGGIIMGRQGIIDGYSTGRGKITLRARTRIERDGKRESIIITETPYQQQRDALAVKIAEAIREERIKGVAEMRDESSERDGEPVRLVLELKRDADADLVLKQLYQFTPLQRTVSLIFLALVDGRPEQLTLKRMMEEFLRHRREVVRRRTEYVMREAKRRGHVLEGQLIAISSLDEVIQICRTAPSRAEAKARLKGLSVAPALMKKALGEEGFAALERELGTLASYSMTEEQADAVVRMQLGQLAALESDEILKEYSALRQQIRSYEELLASDVNLLAVVRRDLEELRDKYADPRRTEIRDEAGYIDMEALIPEETQAISLSNKGFIKRMPLNLYRTQKRGGKGVQGGLRDEDFIEHFFVASTHAYLLCFTNTGQVYWLKVYDIPLVDKRTSTGKHLANVLTLKPEEKIAGIIPVRSFEDSDQCYLLLATRGGLVKKTPLEDYSRPKAGGIIGIRLEENDTLIDVVLVRPGDEVLLATRDGMAIRFAESDVRPMGRATYGVKGISLMPGDVLAGMVTADPEGQLLTVCENGYGKRTPFGPNTTGSADEETSAAEEALDEARHQDHDADEGTSSPSSMRYRKQHRGGKGLHNIKTTERNGKVVRVLAVRGDEEVILMTAEGMVNRTPVEQIRLCGRNTQGVRIMDIKPGDRIVSLAKVARDDNDLEDTVEAPATESSA